MPFAEYKNHADCVKKNKDKRNPDAYCASIERTIKKRKESTTPNNTVEQRPHDYKSPFPGQNEQAQEMFKKERAEHPDFSDD